MVWGGFSEELRSELQCQDAASVGAGRLAALAAVNIVDYDAVSEVQQQQVLIYPNPSPDDFTVVCEGMRQIEVFSVDGRLVKEIKTKGSQCLIEGLDNGVYFVRVVLEKGVMTNRIVKH